MKRISNLYPQLLDKKRVKEIIILASKGKTHRKEVQEVLAEIDGYTALTLNMLKTGKFYLRKTHKKFIYERGKKREITVSPFFPNRILDYIMVETVKPYIKKSMYPYCIGNVDGRGIVYGKEVIERKYKDYKYYIKLDIHRFYPSVSSKKLYEFVEKKIKDKDFLKLCKFILLQSDDLPIGNYYSQWFSNWYLQDLDHYIKEELRVPFYIRYVDDMLLLGNNKRQLARAMYDISNFLLGKGLELKEFTSVRRIETQPIDYLGFKFCPDGVMLRTNNFKYLNRRLKKIRKRKHVCVSQARSLLSYMGWLSQTSYGYIYYKNKVSKTVKKGTLRKIVSISDKKKGAQNETVKQTL